MLPKAWSLSRFLPAPENQAAFRIIQDISDASANQNMRRLHNPILLHGPGGCGKSHLVSALTGALAGCTALLTPAADLAELLPTAQPRQLKNRDVSPAPRDDPAGLAELRQCDVLIVEDLQHLPLRAAELLVNLLDERLAEQRLTVLTASAGPRQLEFRGQRMPARLTSRLSGGLVVAMAPLEAPSRLRLLQELAQRRQLAVAPEILAWLAQQLVGGGRQLEGAVAQLATLSRLQNRPLRLADVRPHFALQIEATRPSLERIVERVGACFRVVPQQLQSRRRSRSVLVPRQVSMFLARRLTPHTLQEIGAYFGGHDHTTVRHACRKVEHALDLDPVLCGTLRQLQAELT
jgi:chromosomal replication initiator protein